MAPLGANGLSRFSVPRSTITSARDRTRDWQAWEKWITRECEGTGEARKQREYTHLRLFSRKQHHYPEILLPFTNHQKRATCTKVPRLQGPLTKCQTAAILGKALITNLFFTLWAHVNSYSWFTWLSVYFSNTRVCQISEHHTTVSELKNA